MDIMNPKDTQSFRYYLAQLLPAKQQEDNIRQRRLEMQQALEYVWEASHLKEGIALEAIPPLFGLDGRINFQVTQEGSVKNMRGNSPLTTIPQEPENKPLNEEPQSEV